MQETDFLSRDLWKEARDKSAAYRDNIFIRVIAWIIRLFFPGKQVMGFGTAESLMMVDLNKYRPNVNVELLIDQGVRLFGLRVIGPTQWIYGNWKYEVDCTFVPYHERIRRYAKEKGVKVWILGYGVHNAWMNEEGNYLGLDPQVTMLKEATRNHECDLYCWDDEVGECWKNGQNTIITPTNLVKSISICMEQTLKEMERNSDGSYKIPVHYSANWFMKKYAWAQYQSWLDNAGADPQNRRFLTWRAWLPVVYSEVFQAIRALFDKVFTPTGIQENNYLKMGSEPCADLWQLTFTAKGPWEPNLGCDASISYGLSTTLTQFAQNANLPLVEPDVTPPLPPAGLLASLSGYSVFLTWTACADAAKYKVYRDDGLLGETTTPAFTDQGTIPGASYTYCVTALDQAGNESGPSNVVLVKIPEGTGNPPELEARVRELETWKAAVTAFFAGK